MLCLIFALVLILAVMAKVRDFDELLSVMRMTRLFPEATVRPLAFGVVGAEAMIALGLLVPAVRSLALVSFGSLLGSFAGFHVWRWSQGMTAPCTCFGKLFTLSAPGALALVALLYVATLVVARPLRV